MRREGRCMGDLVKGNYVGGEWEDLYRYWNAFYMPLLHFAKNSRLDGSAKAFRFVVYVYTFLISR